MLQSLTLFSWFSGLLIIVVIVIDILLAFKFRRYFRSNGFGIVTLTLLSLILAHAVASLIFGITSLTIIVTAGIADSMFYFMKDVGTMWLISSTLLHIMGFTFQRIFSFSYGNKFLKFTRSKTNIGVLIFMMWVISFIITVICMTAASAATFSVFYIGLFVTGVLTIINFVITVETSFCKNKALAAHYDEEMNTPGSPRDASSPSTKIRVVQNPRKTFSLFSGLVFSFILFCLPAAIPNLIFNLQGDMLQQSTSLVISLWLLLGVVFNCLWVLMRLRSTVNDNTGFYARWTLRKSRENITVFLGRGKKEKNALLNEIDCLDDSTGHQTEQEHI